MTIGVSLNSPGARLAEIFTDGAGWLRAGTAPEPAGAAVATGAFAAGAVTATGDAAGAFGAVVGTADEGIAGTAEFVAVGIAGTADAPAGPGATAAGALGAGDSDEHDARPSDSPTIATNAQVRRAIQMRDDNGNMAVPFQKRIADCNAAHIARHHTRFNCEKQPTTPRAGRLRRIVRKENRRTCSTLVVGQLSPRYTGNTSIRCDRRLACHGSMRAGGPPAPRWESLSRAR